MRGKGTPRTVKFTWTYGAVQIVSRHSKPVNYDALKLCSPDVTVKGHSAQDGAHFNLGR